MNLGKTCIGLAVLILSACAASPSQQSLGRENFKPTKISVVEKDNLSTSCADSRSILGCAVQLRQTNQCIVFVKSGLPDQALGCIVTHETKRCFDNAREAAAAKTQLPAACGVHAASRTVSTALAAGLAHTTYYVAGSF